MPSDTSNTWKMMIVPIKPISMATISSTMLKPRARLWRRAFMAWLDLDQGHHDVAVRRHSERRLLGKLPEELDLDGRAVGRRVGDGDLGLHARLRGPGELLIHAGDPGRQARGNGARALVV